MAAQASAHFCLNISLVGIKGLTFLKNVFGNFLQKGIFGLFKDSLPDGYGRYLLYKALMRMLLFLF